MFECFFEGTFGEQIATSGFLEWEPRICRLTLGQDLSAQEKVDLLTLLESARFAVLAAQDIPDFEPGFSFEGYDMPGAFKGTWTGRIVKEVLARPAGPAAGA